MVLSSSVECFPDLQLFKKFPLISRHLTVWHCTVFMAVSHLSLYWDRGIHFTLSHHITSRSIPILSPHLCLCLTVAHYPSVFPTKTLHKFFLPFTCYMPRSSHFPNLTCFIHKSHQWPRLMYLFPLACDASLFAVKLSVCISLQLNCKTRNMLWSKSDEIAGKRKIAGWRDSWVAVRYYYYYLADQMNKIDGEQVRHTDRRKVRIRKRVRKKAFGWLRHRYEGNIKTGVKEIG